MHGYSPILAPVVALVAWTLVMQGKIELGGCNLAVRDQGAAFVGVSPELSFAFTREAISSSAVTSAACHAKRASKRFPDL